MMSTIHIVAGRGILQRVRFPHLLENRDRQCSHVKATIGKRSAIAIYAGAVKGAWTETTEPSGTYAPQYKDFAEQFADR